MKKMPTREEQTEDRIEVGQGSNGGYASLSEVSLLRLVNDGNLEAREELLRRMIRRIQREGGGIDGIVTKT
ncbi:MAG: hypothetical protein COW04_11995 [Deltaproteobacteria bacterium CG12_big_fil_rev_8_21_14_0_65_43_10]|nr:MAG: hypothetical protein AUK23_01345 [Deltaproteobacteria bacterium CG2_30_43_15]PIQ44619.1 MAG: hypothetical protein COW04_11995 [Deltaproteobacteria bacterium CG12_big_fil_rev_8_21_14_0_65_43_10]PIU84349.1 MAG: hypothetical protein COS67_13795 [Deltaproteobacteria bacterium CG06_land_8_20_14_3_00_44_19]PIX24934.1 MAG: hypothetical protein COZ68_05120 [Deltaproteobacteria bacterium CG_4_8_14_3_um_filter_43_13]PIZ19846.1 MAG: hypothetical protein COY50_07915 [Deltaproteobacteria bacterium C